MIPPSDFPRLTPDNHHISSPASTDYNCIAWAAGDTAHWWQPGGHWPVPLDQPEYDLATLAKMFTSLGFEDCAMSADLEPGFDRVALFGDSVYYTHAARQLLNGKWTSKLGKAEDIEHDTPHDIAGGLYGELARIMKRPRLSQPSASPAP